MRRVELIALDLDGVLVDTTPCHAHAYADLWQRMGLSGPPYATIAGRRTTEVVAEASAPLDPDPDRIRDWVRFKQERARHYIATRTIAFPDTLHSLEALANAGFTLALGTGASRETTEIVIHNLNAARLFSTIVTGDDVLAGKPDPEVYLTILDRAGTRADEALVIEDSDAGLEAANAAGTHFASVRSGCVRTGSRFLGAFPDLRAVLQYLCAT